MPDNVEHPTHYSNRMPDGVEVIDVIKAQLGSQFPAYCMGNVLKYVLRWQDKNHIEDLKKARVYLTWAINAMEGVEWELPD